MIRSQQSTVRSAWAQDLVHGAAVTLPAASSARRLRVIEGKLWVTLTSPVASSDEWLARNEEFELPAGESAVIEAWPHARFEMLAPLHST
ncbi:MAG: DUF2917 domain-containing protein [Rhodocyclaceae bacterium]|nr:DUF2917 domain-containing protein [Rhodocyclaceae bacterium]